MNTLFNNIYKGKKVLVTGHTGFKGSWLTFWLARLGANVTGYSINMPSKPNHFELLNLKVTSVMGDVRDKNKVLKTVKKYRPDIIFHLAAQPIVRKSYTEPVETLETNIMGIINVLESCREVGFVKAIVNVTSDKCYQNKELKRGYREEDPMGGDDPYSASKGCSELVANSYRKSFFQPEKYGKTHSTLLADARAGNVIGGGDWAKDRLIPDIMRTASVGKKTSIRNPHSTRPWQHVLEPLSGYLMLGGKLLEGKKEFADNWNFGPTSQSSLSVLEVIKRSKKHWNKINYEIKNSKKNFHEAKLLGIDSSKARARLKWKNVWDNPKTIEKTVTWYKNYYTESLTNSEKDLSEYIEDARKKNLKWTKK